MDVPMRLNIKYKMLDPMEKYLKIKVLWSSILEKIRYFQSTSHAFLFHDHLELLDIISQNVNIYQIEVFSQNYLQIFIYLPKSIKITELPFLYNMSDFICPFSLFSYKLPGSQFLMLSLL